MWRTALGLTAAVLAALYANAADNDADFDALYFRAGFARLHAGLAGRNVIGRLGREPQSEEKTRVLGVPITRWRWRFDNTAFLVVLAANHVIAVKECTNAAIDKC
jgi:hypothetical protein